MTLTLQSSLFFLYMMKKPKFRHWEPEKPLFEILQPMKK